MENQTPIENYSIDAVKPVIQLEQDPKKSNFLIILLSILLFISVLIAGFFAYQTRKLIKELQVTSDKTKQIAEVTPEPTSDPTDDWKTYTNTSSDYQVKYPSDWKVVNQSAGSMGTIVAESRYIEIGLGEGKYGTVGIEETQMIPPSEEVNLTTTKIVGNLTLRCNGKFTTDTKTWCWIKVPNQEKYLNIQLFKNSNEAMNILLDQILSTFKFTN